MEVSLPRMQPAQICDDDWCTQRRHPCGQHVRQYDHILRRGTTEECDHAAGRAGHRAGKKHYITLILGIISYRVQSIDLRKKKRKWE